MIKILVVEDDVDLNRFVAMSLRDRGFDTVSCYDGMSALERVFEEKFDMLLTDIMMPRVDGFELASSVRARNKEIPIIFMTAKDDKASKIYGYNIGIDDYIVKPFDVDVLIMKISALLRRAKIESEKQITLGNLVMNSEERTALVDGVEPEEDLHESISYGRILGLRFLGNL